MTVQIATEASTQPKTSILLRWLFPSIKDILFLGYLLGSLLVNESGVLYDSDTGWHIRNGEHILQTGSWPHSDYFSYTHYAQPWFAWEWLADVALAEIHKYSGLNGIALWANWMFALTFTLLFWWTVRYGGNVLIALILSRLAGFAAAVHWLARPHLFTLFLVLIWYILLERFQNNRNGKYLWILPLLMMLWTNLHGGFVVGLILLGIFALGNYLTSITSLDEDIRTNARRLSWHFTKITMSCLLATLINPYGFWVHKHIFDSYLQSQYLVDRVTEFGSPNFHTLVVKFFELILLSSLLVLGISYKRLTFVETGLILFWSHMALFSVRHVPLYTLIIVPMLVRHLTHYCHRIEQDQRYLGWVSRTTGLFNRYSGNILRFENQFAGWLYPSLITLVMAGICLNHGAFLGRKFMNAGFDEKQFPVKAARFIEEKKLEGNSFTTDYWGGYMIYRFYPKYRVFFDGRSDMYGKDFINKYQKLTNLDCSWKKVLEEYKVAWVLLPVNDGLATALKEVEDWQVLYDDQQAILFRRANPDSPDHHGP